MPIFYYKARNQKGLLIEGQLDFIDLKSAKKKIIGDGLTLVKIGEEAPFFSPKQWASIQLFQGVTLEELLVFNRQLQTVYAVGIPILNGLHLIYSQTDNPFFKEAILGICGDIEQGKTLHEAMARHPKIFDPIYITLVKSGESAGKLEEILDLICYFTEQKAEQTARIKSATFYPKIVVFVMVVVVLIVVYFVVPKVKEFYSKFGADLPMITQVVVGVSNFCVTYWYLLLAAGGGIFWGVRHVLGTDRGKRAFDRYVLKVPIFGELLLQIDMLTLSVVLELLIKSGISLTYALEIVKGALNNSLLQKDLDECRVAIEKGDQIQSALLKSKVLPKMFVNFASVGAEGGKLEHALNRIGSYYKLQVEYKMNNFSKAIEPVLLVFIFGIVLVIALAVFLPLWKMSALIRH